MRGGVTELTIVDRIEDTSAWRRIRNDRFWPMADYTRPDRNGSGYKGAAVIGKRMGPTGS